MSDVFIDTWGTGTPVVLVHGALATGPEEWQEQRPLAGLSTPGDGSPRLRKQSTGGR